VLRLMGQGLLMPPRGDAALEPALARLTRTFRLDGARASDLTGSAIASHGLVSDDDPLVLHLPMRYERKPIGLVSFGAKRSRLPFTAEETGLLELASSYLAASLDLARRRDEQISTLTRLSEQRERVETQGSALGEALVRADLETPNPGLHVFALGPLRAERDGELIRSWGGAKAGTRQAEAVFAFLFDRGERGAAKDEIVELIWPDVDLERADLAFHRTLGGLRTTLEPQRRGRGRSAAVTFANDRYRIDPAVVAWSDVHAFDELIIAAGRAERPEQALLSLEQARALYRGDYLDDCPFYGDSVHVEERREMLRGRYVDVLVALGQLYEERGDRPAAAAAFRQARATADDELPAAEIALTRLGAAS
jgi:DNA-binding SARP family transcriptional activator